MSRKGERIDFIECRYSVFFRYEGRVVSAVRYAVHKPLVSNTNVQYTLTAPVTWADCPQLDRPQDRITDFGGSAMSRKPCGLLSEFA